MTISFRIDCFFDWVTSPFLGLTDVLIGLLVCWFITDMVMGLTVYWFYDWFTGMITG